MTIEKFYTSPVSSNPNSSIRVFEKTIYELTLRRDMTERRLVRVQHIYSSGVCTDPKDPGIVSIQRDHGVIVQTMLVGAMTVMFNYTIVFIVKLDQSFVLEPNP
jgi:hypothetical protein